MSLSPEGAAGADDFEPSYPIAELDRRFYAFTIDRLGAWLLYALSGLIAWRLLFSQDRVLLGVIWSVATVLLVGLAFALMTGMTGSSPGRAGLGLRVVNEGTGMPIGVGSAFLRTAILGVGTLPTFGLGVATLAWTAAMDPGRQRRGWHDQLAGSVVVDIREVTPDEVPDHRVSSHIVNLTAMRLVPAPAAPEPTPIPAARPRPPQPDVDDSPMTAPAAELAQEPPSKTQDRPGEGTGAGIEAAITPTPPAQDPPPPVPVPNTPPPLLATPPATALLDSGRTSVRASAANAPLRWRVLFDTGESLLVEGLGLVGRGPTARPGEPVRHLVALPSTDMSLSKTHGQFHLAPDGVLAVMDRGSTNGSVLVRQGLSRDLLPGKPATVLEGDQVQFGDRTMTVVREA